MMRAAICLLLVLLAVGVRDALAHPGSGIVCTAKNEIYFVLGPSHQVWKVEADGNARTIVTGSLDQPFRVPHHLVLDAQGRLFTASDAGSFVWRIEPTGDLMRIFPPKNPVEGTVIPEVGIGGDPFTIDHEGNIIAIGSRDRSPHTIVRIPLDGSPAELIAGGEKGFRDGQGSAAQFGELHGGSFAWDATENLYLTDNGDRIRRITPDGIVTTIAAREPTAHIEAARVDFGRLYGLAVAPDGSIYAADRKKRCIWRIDGEGAASIFAGSREGGDGMNPAITCDLHEPVGNALASNGDVLVLDSLHTAGGEAARVCRIKRDGSVVVVAHAAPE